MLMSDLLTSQDEEQIRSLKDDNAMLAGHKNLSQKIQYVATLKEENTKLLEVFILHTRGRKLLSLTYNSCTCTCTCTFLYI